MNAQDASRIRENFPAALLTQKRWACSLVGQKRPICPQIPAGYSSVNVCSSVDPDTWYTFEECANHPNPTFDRVGLFLVGGDDIIVVDIDDVMAAPEIQAIVDHLPQTYTEYSWNGNPENNKMHIFVRGSLPANFKAPGIEAYQVDRYMGVTGKVLVPGEITEQPRFLDWLWNTFGKDHQLEHVSLDPSDLECGMAEQMVLEQLNDKSLWDGTNTNPAFRHPPGTEKAGCFNSEAESALATRLAMITNELQVILRLMAASPMIREMADYPWHGRRKILARIAKHTVPSALAAAARANAENDDLAALGAELSASLRKGMADKALAASREEMAKVQAQVESQAPSLPPEAPILNGESQPVPAPKKTVGFKPTAPILQTAGEAPELADLLVQEWDFTYPPGLVGEIANHIYQTSYYPLAIGSLFSALAMCGGIFSNKYYFQNSGLNLYMILTASVGEGKDDLHSIPCQMLKQLQDKATDEFPDGSMHGYFDGYIANGTFTSKKAILRCFEKKASMAIMTDEIGKEFAIMLRPNAGQAKVELKAFLLNAYGRSGPNKKLDGTTYANEEDDVNAQTGRSLSMFGVSNPTSFRDAVQTDDVADGFFARFLVASDASASDGKNKNAGAPMSEYLAWSLATACARCPQDVDSVLYEEVPITPEANIYMAQIQQAYRKRRNKYNDMDMRKSLISRAPQNLNRIAAMIAVGQYFWDPAKYEDGPIITLEDVEWSLGFVSGCIHNVFEEVKQGVFDPNSDARIIKVVQVVHNAIIGEKSIKGKAADLMALGFIDRNYIMQSIGNAKCWRAQFNYGRPKPTLLDATLKEMVDRNYLVPANQMERTQYNLQRTVYKVGEAFTEALELLQDK